MTTELGQAMSKVFQGWSQWAQGDPEAAGLTALSTVAALSFGGLRAWWKRRRDREARSKGTIRLTHELPEGTRLDVRLNGGEEPDA